MRYLWGMTTAMSLLLCITGCDANQSNSNYRGHSISGNELRAANKDSMATENSTSSKTSQSVQSSISSSIEPAGFDNDRRDNSTPQQPTSTSVFNGQKNN